MIPPIWVEVFSFIMMWKIEGWKDEQRLVDREMALRNHFFRNGICIHCGERSS